MREQVMLKGMSEEERAKMGETLGSDPVARQFEVHKKLVERDGAGLAKHGFPAAWKSDFLKAGAEHQQAREQRPAGQAGKSGARIDEGHALREGKQWCGDAAAYIVNRATKVSDPQPDLFTDSLPLRTPLGNEPTVIGDRIGGLLDLFRGRKWKDVLAEMIEENPEFLSVGDRLRASLPGKPATKKIAQADAKQDTREINILDGTLWVHFKAINRAGRRYWGRMRNPLRAAEYNLDILYGYDAGGAPAKPLPPATGSPTTPAKPA